MFNNLKAELVRINLTQRDLAKALSIDEKTLSQKINGKSKFDVDEMWIIKKNFFPNLQLDYLFEKFN